MRNEMKSALGGKKGFTLIELLVVIAIIGILASVILVSLSSARKKARDATRQSDVSNVMTAVELYMNEEGTPPAAGLDNLNAALRGKKLISADFADPLVDVGAMPYTYDVAGDSYVFCAKLADATKGFFYAKDGSTGTNSTQCPPLTP